MERAKLILNSYSRLRFSLCFAACLAFTEKKEWTTSCWQQCHHGSFRCRHNYNYRCWYTGTFLVLKHRASSNFHWIQLWPQYQMRKNLGNFMARRQKQKPKNFCEASTQAPIWGCERWCRGQNFCLSPSHCFYVRGCEARGCVGKAVHRP